jgi:hypothetical protein
MGFWKASAAHIALLFLSVASCPSYGDTPLPGWTTDSKTGCRVWNARPLRSESVTWSGACGNGYAQGQGVEQWYEDGKLGNRLEGEFHDGMIRRGNVTYPNGDHYDGDLNGGRSGHGIYISMNGVRYEGEWRDDKRNGRGVLNWPNGDRYEGDFRDGKANGHGVLGQHKVIATTAITVTGKETVTASILGRTVAGMKGSGATINEAGTEH